LRPIRGWADCSGRGPEEQDHRALVAVSVRHLIAVGILLAVSALLASYLPARLAASVNAVEALRAE